jgi:hypothetical protein
MGSGSQRYLAIDEETTAGTLPSPFNAQKLRVVPGSAIENSRTNITSDEIRDDRQIIVSRLGQNAPALTVPAELSFESFEMLMKGALGSSWVGDYDLNTITVDIAGGNGEIVTDDASNWADKGVAVGDYIVITGLATTAEDGVYVVSVLSTSTMTVVQADGSTAVSFTASTDDIVRIVGGRNGFRVDSSGNNITVSATNKTMTAGSALWVTSGDIRVGDRIYLAGFSNSGNNGFHKVTAVTDTVLTLGNSTLTNETLSTGDLDVANATAILVCGTSLASFSIEEGFTDVSEYHYITGAKVGTWSASIQTDSIITTEFGLEGVTYSGFSASTSTDSLTNANTNDVFDSYTGTLSISGVADCVITGFDFTLDNGLNPRYALLQRNRCSIGEGRINVTGTISAYFPDSTLSDIYNNETNLAATLYFEDLDTNGYTFGFPKLRFNSDTIDVAENDVTESIGFQALGGTATYTTMYVLKQPKVS